MYSTISSALADENISLSRGNRPVECEEWIVAGISDDMIRFTSEKNTTIAIEIKYPEESMSPVFESTKIESNNTRKNIERSHSFIDVWSASMKHMK